MRPLAGTQPPPPAPPAAPTGPRRGRSPGPVVLNLVAALVVLAAAGAVIAAGVPSDDAAPTVMLLMAGLAASAGGAAALMVVFAARLSGDPRVSWAGLVLGWYCLFAIPVSMIRDLDERYQALSAAALLLIHAVAAIGWAVVVWSPAPPSAPSVVRALAIGVPVLIGGAVWWGSTNPGPVQALLGSRWLGEASAVVWLIGSLAVVVRAVVDRIRALGVLGVGLALLGVAQAGGAFLSPTGRGTGPSSSAVGLAGIVVVLAGALWFARRALCLLDDLQVAQEEELRRAEHRLARAVARDHDLRNGLAGLAGAAAVLGGGATTGHLERVVVGELRRLDGMLRTQAEDESRARRGRYAVAPAIEGLVMLRRSAGMDVRADVEPGLHATGSPDTLAQVLTNLLSNAARHAPGSPVRISASSRGDSVEIRVRDFGPGVAPGREQAVLERGVRDERAGGLGLGLYLCRRLLAAEDATIEVRAADRARQGCEVLLELPAGEAAPIRPAVDRPDVRAAS